MGSLGKIYQKIYQKIWLRLLAKVNSAQLSPRAEFTASKTIVDFTSSNIVSYK